MTWLKISIFTNSYGIETLCNELDNIGYSSVEIEDFNEFSDFLKNNKKYWDYVDDTLIEQKRSETKVILYIEDNDETENKLTNIKEMLLHLKDNDSKNLLGSLEMQINDIKEEDWANNWKQYFKPIEVGKKILIQPEWCTYDQNTDRTIFTVNPGMTFGTGTHASTKLCICELENVINKNTVLLDAGCGSGILSIISLLLGAKKAVAVDIDENCIHIAHENASRNSVDLKNFTVYSGDVTSEKELFEKISNEKYDVIVANIVADVIISLLPTVKKLIKKDGIFICSGIIKNRLEDVKNAMKSEGIVPSKVAESGDWALISCKL